MFEWVQRYNNPGICRLLLDAGVYAVGNSNTNGRDKTARMERVVLHPFAGGGAAVVDRCDCFLLKVISIVWTLRG